MLDRKKTHLLAVSCAGAVSLITVLHTMDWSLQSQMLHRLASRAGLAPVTLMLLDVCLRRCARLLYWIPVTIIIVVVMWSYYAYVVHFCWSE